MDKFFEELAKIIEKYGGIVLKLVIVFGLESALDIVKDAERRTDGGRD